MGWNNFRRRDLPVWERVMTTCRPERDRVDPPRPLRRAAAVGAVVGYPALLVLTGVDLGPAVVAVPLLLVAVVLWALSFMVVYEFRRRLANAPDVDLDEREVQQRDTAYLLAMRLLATLLAVVGIAALLVGIARDDTTIVLSTSTAVNIAMTLMMVVVTLPAAIVAWREPEDPPLPDEVSSAGGSPAHRSA